MVQKYSSLEYFAENTQKENEMMSKVLFLQFSIFQSFVYEEDTFVCIIGIIMSIACQN
jgi:hypothetical protein